MICDHDAPYPPDIFEEEEKYSRLKRIGRYHIENYFLEEDILAAIFSDLKSSEVWLHDPKQVAGRLKEFATEGISRATALIVSRFIRRKSGSVYGLPKGCDKAELDQLVALMQGMARSESERISTILADTDIEQLTRKTFAALVASLETDKWKEMIPGRPVFKSFLSLAGIKDWNIKAYYIEKAKQSAHNPFSDILKLFEEFRSISGPPQ